MLKPENEATPDRGPECGSFRSAAGSGRSSLRDDTAVFREGGASKQFLPDKNADRFHMKLSFALCVQRKKRTSA